MARPILAAKRLIKGERLTSKELGYKRINGKLTKPGTKKFNEKVEFTKEEKNRIVDFYKKRAEQEKSPQEKKILEQKVVDREKQFDTKLRRLRENRLEQLKDLEKIRISSIQERRIDYLVKKLNALLSAEYKGLTVEMIKDDLVNRIAKEIVMQEHDMNLKSIGYIKNNLTKEFYLELEKTIIISKFEELNPKQARSKLIDIGYNMAMKYIKGDYKHFIGE